MPKDAHIGRNPHRTPPDVSVIVLNWNDREVIADCLASVFEHGPEDLQMIVIDQGSTDGSRKLIQERFPQAQMEALGENRGFAGGRNEGVLHAYGRYVLFLDADARLQPDTLARFKRFLDSHPDVGLVGPKLVFPDGRFQSVGGYSFSLWRQLLYWTGLGAALKHRYPRLCQYLEVDIAQPTAVDWVAGACQFWRRRVWGDAGPIDEALYYMDDNEWCYRVRKSGWRIYSLPEAQVVHHLGGSGGLWTPLVVKGARSLPRFFRKHYGATAEVLYYALALTGLATRIAVFRAAAALTRAPGWRAKAVWSQRQLLALCGIVSRLPRPTP